MARMQPSEIVKLVTEYIGISNLSLNDFTHQTLAEFYPKYCGLEYDLRSLRDPPGGKLSLRKKFDHFLNRAPGGEQAKIIRGVLKFLPPNPRAFPTRTKELHDELLRVAKRLDTGSPIPKPRLQQTSDTVKEAIEHAQQLIGTKGAPAAVDRMHTALHGHLKAIADERPVKYEDDAMLSTVFGRLREEHPAFASGNNGEECTLKILRSLSKIMDDLNIVRNQSSYAHANKVMLGSTDGMLAVNTTHTILHYVDGKIRDWQAGGKKASPAKTRSASTRSGTLPTP